MSIFSFSFFHNSNINKKNITKKNKEIENNYKLLIENEKYPDTYKELKKDLEINPFFLTF